MRIPTPKPNNESLGMWNVYVAEGSTKADRNARLSQAPKALHQIIKNHVTLVFRMRKL